MEPVIRRRRARGDKCRKISRTRSHDRLARRATYEPFLLETVLRACNRIDCGYRSKGGASDSPDSTFRQNKDFADERTGEAKCFCHETDTVNRRTSVSFDSCSPHPNARERTLPKGESQ